MPRAAMPTAGGQKVFNVAAMITVGTGSGGVSLRCQWFRAGFALETHPLGMNRPRAKDGRVESAPLIYGQGSMERW